MFEYRINILYAIQIGHICQPAFIHTLEEWAMNACIEQHGQEFWEGLCDEPYVKMDGEDIVLSYTANSILYDADY